MSNHFSFKASVQEHRQRLVREANHERLLRKIKQDKKATKKQRVRFFGISWSTFLRRLLPKINLR